MELDGVTPTPTSITIAREAFGNRPGVMVMIRPRGGDFCYSSAEVVEMEWGIETAVSQRANGVVFGAIHNNSLDLEIMSRLVTLAHKHNLATTCHRAFDATRNPSEALEMLIDLGVSRVLTSGTPWGSNQSAVDGIPQLKRLIQQADNRIEIVLGGGVNIKNIEPVLEQLPTHESQLTVHAYSTVLHNGVTNLEAVRKLVSLVAIFDNQQGERYTNCEK